MVQVIPLALRRRGVTTRANLERGYLRLCCCAVNTPGLRPPWNSATGSTDSTPRASESQQPAELSQAKLWLPGVLK